MKRLLVEGFILLFPLVLTLVLLQFLVGLVASPLDLWIAYLFPNLPFAPLTSQLIALAIICVSILIFGFFARRLIVEHMLKAVQKLLRKIPFIRAIYHSTHEVVTTVLGQEETVFSEVITLPFGDTGGRVLGFTLQKKSSFENTSPILVSGAPNLLQGFALYVPAADVTVVQLPVKKAVRWNLSLGTLPL